jgi:hypothetical protein
LEIAFQPAGQGQHVSHAWCRTADLDAMREDAARRFGEPVYWRVSPFTPGRPPAQEVIRKNVSSSKTDLRNTSWPIDAGEARAPWLRHADAPIQARAPPWLTCAPHWPRFSSFRHYHKGRARP